MATLVFNVVALDFRRRWAVNVGCFSCATCAQVLQTAQRLISCLARDLEPGSDDARAGKR